MKTAELTGADLDWAVAKCEGFDLFGDDSKDEWIDCGDGRYRPSEYWAQGGPIIEREEIDVNLVREACITERGTEVLRKIGWCACWSPSAYWLRQRFVRYGDTPLIAAMRCFVASKLGDNINLPTETT